MSEIASTKSLTTSLIANVTTDLYRDEGNRPRAYRDSRGLLTIGVGHNLDARGLCPAAIRAQFDFDLSETINALDARLAWWKDTPEDVQRVLINLGFNMGVPGLLRFAHMLLAIKTKNYPIAARELMDSDYAKQVPERASRLAELLRNAPTATL